MPGLPRALQPPHLGSERIKRVFAIVGLGNPGQAYALTRHNIGARVVQRAASQWSISLEQHNALRLGKGTVGREIVAVALPLTWMNLCGSVVQALLQELGLSSHQLIVVHDDLDLELGRLRIKTGGGSGGHNGVRSIIEALKTGAFARVKIGIGRPHDSGQGVSDYVLSDFAPSEIPRIEKAIDQAVAALACLVTEGVLAAMNRYNRRDQWSDRQCDRRIG
ncbi:MAG: aminoacyl-tRNA hydrolase [Nitrospirae bacterium]|nr:MAG: aminoacyl-tRNA hydrolase [Nitrospirota bacterium]